MQVSASTHLPASSVETVDRELPRSPCIPPKLVSLILIKLWEAPLSSHERSSSLKNISLVNRTWHALVAPIASSDVHVFSYDNAHALSVNIYVHYHHRDRFIGDARWLAREMCHSLTFHANGNPLGADLSKATPAFWESFRFNQAIVNLMDAVTWYDRLPNLRHVSIRYMDWVYNDIILQAVFGCFPRHVTHLSVHYSFTAPATAPSFDTRRIQKWLREGRYRPTKFMCIRHLSLSGMPMAFMATLVLMCPKMETLEIAHPSQLAVLPPLPATLRTLVLCHPGVTVCRETMASWALDTVLDAGLFPKESDFQRRIILRSGTPDPAAFTELKRACQGFNAELVYERDDSGTRIRSRVSGTLHARRDSSHDVPCLRLSNRRLGTAPLGVDDSNVLWSSLPPGSSS
ncbi:hypothetical protein GSI_08836 [Ganoderma sinense ZZ0214-1]|uniref:F-box domain-containing protein n=1 Tax=Ganoderma sinense ZZ0214-1 TaxID=1077348 RepID=A0A2G8S4U7_9APHY|nr:hypothetical protein GSI_08836 [Ganoderma sinense ZZ0214-1]